MEILSLDSLHGHGSVGTALLDAAKGQARKIKPEIPLIGMDGIPIRHEIKLEFIF